MNSSRNMSGRTAVITGGSSGIGESIAYRFASEGANVVVASRSLERCQAVATTIRSEGGAAVAIACDVTDEEATISLFDRTIEEFGRVDVVVASAGISGGNMPLEDYPLTDWNRIIQTNLTGAFLTAREAFRRMKGHGGHIIVISSQAGIEGYAQKGVYCASKFGVRGMAHVLGEEGRRYNINVSALCPGTAQTPILAATGTAVQAPLSLDALADAAVFLANLRGNSLIRDILLERMDQS
ncbi:SDR family oxidoreductase [Streptomyces sp. NPDC005828]|uniref:SDR family oxidoreductase n=1 Tax=Streptomyces sp. NPDC005828 TaxID=3157071 RepID=UPI0033D5AECD